MSRWVRTLFEGRVHALVGAVVVVVDERLHARARRRRDEGLDLALAGGGHWRRVDHELSGRLQEDTCSQHARSGRVVTSSVNHFAKLVSTSTPAAPVH